MSGADAVIEVGARAMADAVRECDPEDWDDVPWAFREGYRGRFRLVLRAALEEACVDDGGPLETSKNGCIVGWDLLAIAAYGREEE